jgi:Tfp pilus assembly protein PilF
MPAKNFMVIDARRDDSFRIPRPDLTMSIGVPNARNQCRADQTANWAARAVRERYAKNEPPFHYGQAIHAGRNASNGAERLLIKITNDPLTPTIARATAVSLLADYPSAGSWQAIEQGLTDRDPMVKVYALNALKFIRASKRYKLAAGLLEDPVASVRITASRILAATPRPYLSERLQIRLDQGIDEYIAAQQENADHACAHNNLGNLYLQLDQQQKAGGAYKKALSLDPNYVPGYVNLADLYRGQHQEHQAEGVLRAALKATPDTAIVYHALGLSLVRQRAYEQALRSLQHAVMLSPDNARFGLAYAISLNSLGSTEKVPGLLQSLHEKGPTNRDDLISVVKMNRDAGHIEAALEYAEQLQREAPEDARISEFRDELT